MVIPLWAIIAMIGVSLATAVFAYQSASKAQKQNKMQPSQLDGSIAEEGVSFSDIAGSPHMFGNIVDIYGQRTTEIKAKAAKK